MQMTPRTLLEHHDNGELWPEAPGKVAGFELAAAYQLALKVRKLRVERGEIARGFKIGFTNRTIWERYQVFAPIWGTVWNTSLVECDGQGRVVLAACSQPRIEPEVVFGMKSRPVENASLEDLFHAIEWVAPGFEIVQSHSPGWKFTAPDTVVDGGLHARLLLGRKMALAQLASSASALHELLAAGQVVLFNEEQEVERGQGANVLDSPLMALHHFLSELRRCPGAPDLSAGDVITTGTWTDAWPVRAGEQWSAEFSVPESRLQVEFG